MKMEQQKMNSKEALIVLDKVCSIFKGTREEHDTIKKALVTLANIVNPQPKEKTVKEEEKKKA